jgi:hypothetical protein
MRIYCFLFYDFRFICYQLFTYENSLRKITNKVPVQTIPSEVANIHRYGSFPGRLKTKK